MTAHQAIVEVIEPLLKDRKLAIKIANQAITALDNGGWFTTEDEHLAMMRTMRKQLFARVADDEVPARDLAALTNRLQSISKEVVALEEKERQENRGKTSGKSNDSGSDTNANDVALDPSQL